MGQINAQLSTQTYCLPFSSQPKSDSKKLTIKKANKKSPEINRKGLEVTPD
jgi:hypothetical protein